MTPDEKSQLLALLEHRGTWCREAEARDADGESVTYDDDAAVAWDITGALCRLFGWRRACDLFPQLERHVTGGASRIGRGDDRGVDAMTALQDFNDRGDTTFEALRASLEALPIRDTHSTRGAAGDA